MRTEHVPVLIVGGGPAGLSSALFLARAGVRPLLVERRPQTSTLTRATGVHARSMELFREAGIEEDIRAVGLRLVPPELFERGVRPEGAIPRIILRAPSLAELDGAQVIETGEQYSIDLGPAPPAWCGQDLLEPIMLRATRERGVDARFSTELESFETDADGVDAVIRDQNTGERTRIRADYLIAADGNAGELRGRLGIARSGKGLLQRMISVVFRADLSKVVGDRKFILSFIAGKDLQGVAVCLDGANRWMFWTGFAPDSGVDPADLSVERCTEMVRTAIGDPEPRIEIEGRFPWEAAHWIADSFRSGRVFLVGDCAHVHPPDGGFGANAGIQDGHNLAWKLAAVLSGAAGPELLDTYEAERRPVGAATADQAYLRERNRATAGRDPGFRDFPVVIMGYRYSSSAVIDSAADPTNAADPGSGEHGSGEHGGPGEVLPRRLDLSGRPGTRLPHLWLRRADGGRVSTLDLGEGGFVLIGDAASEGWGAAVKDAAAEIGIPLRWAGIGDATGLAPEDPESDWAGRLGLSTGGALLVRPDGFVAWRTAERTDRTRALRTALDRILARTPTNPEV